MISNIVYALKNIWRWGKAYYAFFIPSIPIYVFLSFLDIYFQKIMIDAVENNQPITKIIWIISLFFCTVLILNLCNEFLSSRLNMRKYNFSILYQNKITEKFMRTDFSNTDNSKVNIKYSHAMDDACSGQCAPEFICQSLFYLLISILGIFTYGTIIAAISPLILVLLFLSAILTYFINRWQRNYIEKNKDHWISLDRKINYLTGFSSKFEYAKDIQIFKMSHWINQLLVSFQNKRFDWTKKVSRRSLTGVFLGAVLALLRDGAAYVILIIMLLNKQIGAGDFVFYFGAITGFSMWLNGISERINEVVSKSIKIGYYRDYFEVKETLNHSKGCALPCGPDLPIEIVFNNVSYRYPQTAGDSYALKNIHLCIHKGERLAVVGMNGADKTTLVKLICGFYTPSEGEILVNGKNVKNYNIEEYYTLYSAVFQDMYLLPVTIEEFITSSEPNADKDRLDLVIRQAGLRKKIDSLRGGVRTRLMKGVFDDSIDLSSGEKQKLMLARALYKDAPVILSDEPTAALDPIAENELYLKYFELTHHKTSVYISHRLASTRFCDRIIYLEDGRIVEEGTHDALIKLGGKYAHLFDLQSRYYKEAPYEASSKL